MNTLIWSGKYHLLICLELILNDASPNTYSNIRLLQHTGDLEYIHELETAKYIKVEQRMGLPDGSMKNERFLRIIPLNLGAKVKHSLANTQHNKALKSGTPQSGAP